MAFQLALQARKDNESPRKDVIIEPSQRERAAFALAGAGGGNGPMVSARIREGMKARLVAEMKDKEQARQWIRGTEEAAKVSSQVLATLSQLCPEK